MYVCMYVCNCMYVYIYMVTCSLRSCPLGPGRDIFLRARLLVDPQLGKSSKLFLKILKRAKWIQFKLTLPNNTRSGQAWPCLPGQLA